MSSLRSRNETGSLVQRCFHVERHELARRVASGVAWQFGLSGLRVIATIGSTAVLARLLSPSDYGLVAMTTVVVEVAGLFSNLGFGAILIQKRRLARVDLDAVFWASLIIGAVVGLLVCIAAYPVAWFFKEPRLVELLWLSALSLVIQQMTVVPSAVISRLLLFRLEVLLQAGQLLVRIAIAIALAWAGAGVWSLVISPFAAIVLYTTIVLSVTGYCPRRRLNRSFIAENWRMSGSFLGSGILHYVQSNFDFMVVGRRFGAEQLGYYQTAYSVPDELRNRLSGPLQRVLFPAYSLLQQDLIAFRDAVGRSQKMLAAVLLPIGAGLAVVAEEFVGVVYGARWAPVVPLLQVLAVGGALRATFSLVASIFYATGRPDLALKINLVSAPFVLGAILAGSEWGVIGVAWAMVLVMLPSFVSAHIAMKLIGGSLVTFLDAQWTPALGTLCMVLSLIVGKGLLSLSDSVAVALVLQIVVGGVIYLTTLVLIDRAFVKEGLAICASVLARKR